MKTALTFKDFSFSFADILHVDRIEVDELPDQHGTLRIQAVLDADLEGSIFFQVPRKLSLLYEDDEGEKPLFSGLLVRSSMKRKGKYLYLELEAKSHTYQMDLKREIRSFQNEEETGGQVIREILKDYPDCICMEHFEDGPIGQFLLQYEETDWEFIRRVANKYHGRLYPQSSMGQPAFAIGFPKEGDGSLPQEFFSSSLSFDVYEDRKANASQGLMPQQFFSWNVESYEIIPLGARISYRGKDWLVGGVKRRLEKGLLKNAYTLVQEETQICPPAYNPLLPGISLDGTVKNVVRDRLQVIMDFDSNTRTAGQYWFPYSTVAGSSDGSGWYCMPEAGERIRIYFPEGDEGKAYAISALSGNTLGNQGVSMDPASKHISTAQGNTVTFNGDGANISVKGGTGSVHLGSGGDLDITAAVSISIYAGSKVTFQGNEILAAADQQMKLSADPGASIQMEPGQTDLKAVKIYQN